MRRITYRDYTLVWSGWDFLFLFFFFFCSFFVCLFVFCLFFLVFFFCFLFCFFVLLFSKFWFWTTGFWSRVREGVEVGRGDGECLRRQIQVLHKHAATGHFNKLALVFTKIMIANLPISWSDPHNDRILHTFSSLESSLNASTFLVITCCNWAVCSIQ